MLSKLLHATIRRNSHRVGYLYDQDHLRSLGFGIDLMENAEIRPILFKSICFYLENQQKLNQLLFVACLDPYKDHFINATL